MKRRIGVLATLTLLIGSTAIAQDLKVGVGGGALFVQGPRPYHSELYDRGGCSTSYSLGGEVIYSIPSLPIDPVGGASYAPVWQRHWQDSALVETGNERHRHKEGSLFSAGVEGRWTPMRGLVSPYLGLSLQLTHLSGIRSEFDSTLVLPAADGTSPDEVQDHRHVDDTRFGIGVGVGSQFSLFSSVDLDVGARYTLNNLFEGRHAGSLNSISFGASVLFKVL